MIAMSECRAKRLGAFLTRAIPQFQVTMRTCDALDLVSVTKNTGRELGT
jgi:hypothetical protein